MAYENYSSVSWSNGTPITGDRLQQMSTNIQQVKEATDDYPQGILRYKKNTTTLSFSDTTGVENLLISLKDNTGSGGSDDTVNADANRLVRLTLTFPGISIRARGAENTRYVLAIKKGIYGAGAPTTLATYYFNPSVYTFLDVSSDPAQTTQSVRANSAAQGTYIGAGQYSIIEDSTSSGLSSESYFVSITREVNSNMANAPAYYIMNGSSSPIEFYAEDVGGS